MLDNIYNIILKMGIYDYPWAQCQKCLSISRSIYE